MNSFHRDTNNPITLQPVPFKAETPVYILVQVPFFFDPLASMWTHSALFTQDMF